MIDVITALARRDIDYLVMHHNSCPTNAAMGVVMHIITFQTPFMFGQSLVIGRVNYCEFPLGKRDKFAFVHRLSSVVHR